MSKEIYSAPDSSVDTPIAEKGPNLILRILCWAVSILSVVVLYPLGLKEEQSVPYAIGFGFGGIVLAAIISLPFYIFRYFRRPNPRRAVYLFWLLFFFVFGALGTLVEQQ